MRFQVALSTDNAAFADDGFHPGLGSELARILRGLADKLEDQQPDSDEFFVVRLHDINGNRVGFAAHDDGEGEVIG